MTPDLLNKHFILEDNAGRIAFFKANYPQAIILKTAQAMIDALQTNYCNRLFLDHDLNNEAFVDSNRADCGMEVVRWIVANRPEIDEIWVHTANKGAAGLMWRVLTEAGYTVKVEPFGGEYDSRG